MPKNPHPAHPKRSHAALEVLQRAELALRMQRPSEAERLAETVLKADRGHAAAAALLGQALLAQHRATEAIAHLERAARRSDDVVVATVLAAALAAAGRDDDALKWLQGITEKPVAYPPAFREHAGLLAKRGRTDDAIAIARRGIALSPDSIELRLDLAALHLGRNNRRAARDVLVDARDAAPGRPDVLAELARVTLLDGDHTAAADLYRHALALQPNDAMMRSNLAACQLELGQRDAGEASLRSVMNGRPQMMGRAIYALSASSHGRFFLRPSAAAKFLKS